MLWCWLVCRRSADHEPEQMLRRILQCRVLDTNEYNQRLVYEALHVLTRVNGALVLSMQRPPPRSGIR